MSAAPFAGITLLPPVSNFHRINSNLHADGCAVNISFFPDLGLFQLVQPRSKLLLFFKLRIMSGLLEQNKFLFGCF